jgi:cyclopropane fatty-acyl-phospholipid synthase-like methyltransferase
MSETKPKIDPHPLSTYNTLAWERKRDPILNVLKTLFPEAGEVLELASGSGAHINYFAPHFPLVRFQPSDCDVAVFGMIAANRSRSGNTNVLDPLRIDLTAPATWPDKGRLYDAIFAINVFHLAPAAAADGFAQIAARCLKPSGVAAAYGPFRVDGRQTAPSNDAFDKQLRASGNAGWGLKDVRDLETAAGKHGLGSHRRLDMPANNVLLSFGRVQHAQAAEIRQNPDYSHFA